MHTVVPSKSCLANFNDLHNLDIRVAWINLAGLHHLHLVPVRGWQHFERWLGYYDSAMAAMTQLLDTADYVIFQTTNWVCEDKFNAAWRDTVLPVYDPTECVQRLETQPKRPPPDRNLTRDCLDATMTGYGSSLIYKQEMKLLSEFESNPRVLLVDSYDMVKDKCWATQSADGRHFKPIVPLKVEAVVLHLKHLVAQWQKRSV